MKKATIKGLYKVLDEVYDNIALQSSMSGEEVKLLNKVDKYLLILGNQVRKYEL